LERVLEGADVRSPEGRARAAEAALVVVAEHPSDLVRDQYVMRVADRTRIDPARLRERLERIVRGSAGPPVEVERPRVRRGGRDSAFGHAAGSAFGHAAVPRAEMEVLRIAVHCPDEVAHRLHETLFDGGVARRAYLALARADTLQDAIAEADETGDQELDVLLHRLAVEEPKSESDLALAALVRIAVERRMPHDPETLRWLKPTLDELSESSSQPAAIDRLVRWLGDRFQEGV
jgi:DNA primase